MIRTRENWTTRQDTDRKCTRHIRTAWRETDSYGHPFPLQNRRSWIYLLSTYRKTKTGHISQIAFPTLRAIFPSLFWRMADQDPTLSDQDKKTISNCFVLHQPSNTPRLPDIKLWMHVMGIDMISFQAIVETLPCLGDVSIHPKPPAKSRMEPRGLNAYCHNCSEILSHLGEAWNLRSSTERLTMTLKHSETCISQIHMSKKSTASTKSLSHTV